jgi:hypothetical protein
VSISLFLKLIILIVLQLKFLNENYYFIDSIEFLLSVLSINEFGNIVLIVMKINRSIKLMFDYIITIYRIFDL